MEVVGCHRRGHRATETLGDDIPAALIGMERHVVRAVVEQLNPLTFRRENVADWRTRILGKHPDAQRPESVQRSGNVR